MATTTATTTPKTAAEALTQIRARKAASSTTSTATSTKPKTAAEALVLIRARKAAEEQARLEAETAAQANKGSFLGNLAKAIIRPVATIAARPIQLGQSLELSARKALFPQNVRPGETQETVQNILPSVAPSIIAPAPQGARDVVKDVGRAAETVALGVGGGGAVQAAKTGFKGLVLPAAKAGAVQGAKAGALGGAGLSLEEGNLNPVDVGVDAATGALGGALIGGVVGPAASLLRPNPNASRNAALEITKPVLTKAERTRAILEGRSRTVGNTPLTRRTEIVAPSKREIEIADAVKDVVKRSYAPERNIREINKTVSSIDDSLTRYLDENKTIFNTNQLRARLATAKDKSRVIFAGDPVLESRYTAIIDEMVDNLDSGDLSGLFKARKAFDQTVRDKFPRSFDGNPSDNVTKNAILDVRREVNDFIADMLPAGNQFKAQLRREHLMLEAAENIAENAEKLIKTKPGRRLLNFLLQAAAAGAVGTVGINAVSAGGR